jgi:hypothetical protein
MAMLFSTNACFVCSLGEKMRIALFNLFMVSLVLFSYGETVIAVSGFGRFGDISISDGMQITNTIYLVLSKDKRFIPIDRTIMAGMRKEQNKSEYPECSLKKCVVEVGKSVFAQMAIGGSVGRKQNIIMIKLLLVDVEKEVILNCIDTVYTTTHGDFFNRIVPALCSDLFMPQSPDRLLSFEKNDRADSKPMENNSGSFFSKSYNLLGAAGVVLATGAIVYHFLTTPTGNQGPGNRTGQAGDSDIPIDNAPRRP